MKKSRGKSNGNLILTILLWVVLNGCGYLSTPRTKILGRWKQKGGMDLTLEFFRDGTVKAKSMIFTMTGRYNFLDDNSIRMNLEGYLKLAGSEVLDVNINGKLLTLSYNGLALQFESIR